MKLFLAALPAVAAGAALAAWSDYPREAVFMTAIFVLAASFWVTEALPLFATALLVIGAQVVLLANPGGWALLGFSAGPSPSVQAVFSGAADPVLLLFLGGLMLARAAERTQVGVVVSSRLLAPVAHRPRLLLLAAMAVTGMFSMWMSNTATAAMMIALLAPWVADLADDDPLRKGLLLGVPFAANIGGLGTPIASPPNAVAIGFLQSAGYHVGFLEWMAVAVPLVAGLLVLTWLALLRVFPPAPARPPRRFDPVTLSRSGAKVVGVFVITAALWLTTAWHGWPASVVALVPIVALTSMGVLVADDVNRLDWTVLILIAGGISLGAGLRMTGLDTIMAGWLPFDAVNSPAALRATLVVGTLVLGTLMSNTAVANMVLPVCVSAGAAVGAGTMVVELTVSVALAASLAMALPISTPPNAIAYARGGISTREMAGVGIGVGIVGVAAILLFGPQVLRFWGIA